MKKQAIVSIILAALFLCACSGTAPAVSESTGEHTAPAVSENTGEQAAPAVSENTGEHLQDIDALASFMAEEDTIYEKEEDDEPDFEVLDHMDNIDAIFPAYNMESVGTGVLSSMHADAYFGNEGLQDFTFVVNNYGAVHLFCNGIGIYDSREEVEQKMSNTPHETEEDEDGCPIYYFIWNADAEYPFVSLKLHFDENHDYVDSWEFTDYFQSYAENNPHYLSLTGNYSAYLTKIRDYIAEKKGCAPENLTYYGEINVGGEPAVAFAYTKEPGGEPEFYYGYMEYDEGIATVDQYGEPLPDE